MQRLLRFFRYHEPAGTKELRSDVQSLCQSAITVREHKIAQMNLLRITALDRVKESHGITTKEFEHALDLGRRAIKDYQEEKEKEGPITDPTNVPKELLAFIYQLLQENNPRMKSIVRVTTGWRLSPGRIEWCVGSLPTNDGKELDDFMLFECNLVLSKFWLPLLSQEKFEAILGHEVTHILQNSFDCEPLVLNELCSIKNKQLGWFQWQDKIRRKRDYAHYLHWTEYNADQFPSISGIEAATKMQKFLSSPFLATEMFASYWHPATQERLKEVREIVTRLHLEKWLHAKKVCRECPDFKNCKTGVPKE